MQRLKAGGGLAIWYTQSSVWAWCSTVHCCEVPVHCCEVPVHCCEVPVHYCEVVAWSSVGSSVLTDLWKWRDDTVQEYELALAPTLQRNTMMLAICEIGGGTLWSIQWLNAKGQPSRYQGVSLPHAATWRPGALGVLVCACVAWVCGLCVCVHVCQLLS